MLDVQDVDAGYAGKQVLFGASLQVQAGQRVAMIGPNGAGKSTLLKVIAGLVPRWKGELSFDGGRKSAARDRGSSYVAGAAGAEISFVPQGRRVFPGLSVHENLLIGGHHLDRTTLRRRFEDVLSLFPVLQARLRKEASTLSGGEQQMVAIGRSLMSRPRLLLLDEPSLGLAPKVLEQVYERLLDIHAHTNMSILVVEQKVEVALDYCQFAYGLKLGRVVTSGDTMSYQGVSGRDRLRHLFL